jgi:hypothetical protein
LGDIIAGIESEIDEETPEAKNTRVRRGDHLDIKSSSGFTLSNAIELCAWASIVTLVGGYIWVRVVLAYSGATGPFYFTISDYLAYGATPDILIAAVPFALNLSNAFLLENESPRPAKYIFWQVAFCIIVGIALVAVVNLVLYLLGVDLEQVFRLRVLLRSFVSTACYSALLIFSHVFRPIRFSILTVAFLGAGAFWVDAWARADEFMDSVRRPNTKDLHAIYKFQSEALDSSQWFLFLSSDRYFFFQNRSTMDVVTMRATDLTKVTYASP